MEMRGSERQFVACRYGFHIRFRRHGLVALCIALLCGTSCVSSVEAQLLDGITGEERSEKRPIGIRLGRATTLYPCANSSPSPATLPTAASTRENAYRGYAATLRRAPSNAIVTPRAIFASDARYGGAFIAVVEPGLLRTLSTREGSRIIGAAAALTERRQLQPWNESADVALRQAQIADALASYGIIAKSASPRVASAYAEMLTSRNAGETFDAESLRALQPALAEIARRYAPPSRGAHIAVVEPNESDWVKITGGGTPTYPGGIPQTLKPGKYVIDDNHGKACYRRVASSADYAVDPKTGRTRLLWDPADFLDIGLLVVQDAKGRRESCTVTLLNPQWALTAGHCVIREHAADSGAKKTTLEWKYGVRPSSGASTARVYFPHPADSPSIPTQECDDSKRKCHGYSVALFAGDPKLPPGTRWSAGTVVPDIALLPLVFKDAPFEEGGAPAARHIVLRTDAISQDADVAIVGVGMNDNLGARYDGWILNYTEQVVGYIDDEVFGWSPDLKRLGSSACRGDSGGPIYRVPVEDVGHRKVVVGLVSRADAGADSADPLAACRAARAYASRVAKYRDWICGYVMDRQVCPDSSGR